MAPWLLSRPRPRPAGRPRRLRRPDRRGGRTAGRGTRLDHRPDPPARRHDHHGVPRRRINFEVTDGRVTRGWKG
ncbi:hypothetical protein ACFQVA_06825 [Actinomadura keratinilytica]